MKLAGMLRVKNEARWIRRVVSALFNICEKVYVLDDHSTDDTDELCRRLGDQVEVFPSPFNEFNETADKNYLYDHILCDDPEWILHIDGDELLAHTDQHFILEALESPYSAFSLRVIYLWDNEQQMRTDGVYGNFNRPSLFRADRNCHWTTTTAGGNMHCTNIPQEMLPQGWHSCAARLLHFGYLHQADRLAKFAWYNQRDPNNAKEDCYRHIIAGDPGGPLASERTKYAGPLRLEPLTA